MVTLDQCIVFPVVFVLRNGSGGVFGNQLFREAGNNLNLIIERGALCINGVCVQVFIMDHPAGLKQYLPVLGKVGNGPEEQPLDALLVQMRCAAAVFAFEFAVALPDHPAVLVRAVSDLAAVEFAAIAADDLCRERAEAVVVLALGLPDRHFILHLLPFLRIDNGRMALVHNVLRHLALVDLHLFGKEIHGEFLLQDRRALVFFVRQDALYGAGLPFFLAARRGDALGCKVCGDPVHRFALNEQFVDFPYNLRLLRHNLRQAVRPFAVSSKDSPTTSCPFVTAYS